MIVCVGGDGTFNEVINGFMDERDRRRIGARVGFLPCGTGCDLSRTVQIPADPNSFFDLLLQRRGRWIDLGCLHFRDFSNRPGYRYFHNVVSFGLGGDVVRRVNEGRRFLGTTGLFLRSALLSLCRQGKKRIRLRIDDGKEIEMEVWNVAVANGRYHGGGMCIAPEAAIDDGLFHITIIGDLTLGQVLLHFPKLYNGRIGSIQQVLSLTGRQIDASSAQPVLVDLDGELPGTLPVRAEIVPRALFLVAEDSSGHGEEFPTGGA